MDQSFIRAYPPAQPGDGPVRWLLFQKEALVLGGTADAPSLIADMTHPVTLLASPPLFLGTLDAVNYVASDMPADAPLPEGLQTIGLRSAFGKLNEAEFSIAGYASQMLLWQRSSRFCPVCAGPTEQVGGDWGRRCTVCGFSRYPQISPAILALVHNGDRVLLTHKPGWGPMFSIIAGFVEPNESLEACVHREVLEESGLRLGAVTYYGSQGWPFPAQLMIGFMCQYSAGEIAIDDKELDEARWFHVDDLPPLPGAISLSRQLLDAWVAARGRGV